MAIGARLDLRQSQSLVMTPQLRQAIKLLELSNLEVEGFLGEAIAGNPLLELAGPADGADPPDEGGEPDAARRTRLESSPVDRLIDEGRAADDRPLDIDPAAAAERGGGEPDERFGAGDRGGRDVDWSAARQSFETIDHDPGEAWEAREDTLIEHLDRQLGAAAAPASLKAVARRLIGALDSAGYLATPLAEVAGEIGASPALAEAALALVQSLDPAGIGARTLAECLALQARDADRYDPAMARLLDNLELVARGERARLKRVCGVDDDDLADMLAELRGYDPKPGLRFGAPPAIAVAPDVVLSARADGGWDIAIADAALPRLIVNRAYYLALRAGCADRAARGWLSERLTDANGLVKALDQRQKTILKVVAEIVRQQDGFFRRGVGQHRPLTLRAIADAIGIHESTVSRVTSNKYLLCPRGLFELKYFFTSGVAAVGGEGAVSAEAVKAAIRQLIDGEPADAAHSDDVLVDRLRERGFDLARRTVAKYREAIGLGSSVQRRRQRALAGTR